ncbi:PSP1 C-terminal conserved region, putative [Trypanosoma equiperdum]|uniref:PSP1 C-terminal domain-containing protein n=2 Tax=Trypanozoon TaxID=39700 RepID=Q381W0_TRYB2|nr:hypothetical protein, conserved [Trypanosoma brucei brucei TREU927]EAN80421.1 hypothetical protein, conserved [Trypanosoma brucei brucei TREU927]SCU67792.1 PSP1 C-terminal conserved region, putative [Trypanosoma equiperdum]
MFHDLTNVTQSKRQVHPHHMHESDMEVAARMTAPVFTTDEGIAEKLDQLSRKVDAIYGLMLHLVQQRQLPTAPELLTSTSQTSTIEAVHPAFPEEEPNFVSMLSSAMPHATHSAPQFFESPTHDPLTSGTIDTVTTPMVSTRDKEEEHIKATDNKRALSNPQSSSATRGDDHNSWKRHDCFILLVEFKCQRMKRCVSSSFITPGQYAIVQGDRGHDCGVVNQCSEWNAEKGCIVREESFDGNVTNVVRMKGEMGRVLRVATEEEVERLFGEISRNENLALKTCREIVARLGLDMDVVDCEYQFDQQKISFYYEASRSIDFRQLNSELFRIFGVRIWLQNVNNSVKNVVPAGAMSREEKTQYQKSGLRPPTYK